MPDIVISEDLVGELEVTERPDFLVEAQDERLVRFDAHCSMLVARTSEKSAACASMRERRSKTLRG